MGIERWLRRTDVTTRMIDTVKNMIEEESIIEGIKRTAREELYEDNPLTSKIYQTGKYDGKVEGYAEASDVYEEKLLEQADEFLKQKQIYESERDAYEELLNEYENEIDVLSERVNRTEAENEYLQQLLLRERKLRKLAG